MQERGPARGYYLETTKSILVVALGNIAWAEEHFWDLVIWVVTRHQYLGGYIEDAEAKRGVATGQNLRVDGVCGNPFQGLPRAPAVCLRRTAEFTPTGVGIHAAGDPRSNGT